MHIKTILFLSSINFCSKFKIDTKRVIHLKFKNKYKFYEYHYKLV